MIIGDLVRCFFFQKSIVTVSNGSQDAFSSKKKSLPVIGNGGQSIICKKN
jgi:hypothetical protein